MQEVQINCFIETGQAGRVKANPGKRTLKLYVPVPLLGPRENWDERSEEGKGFDVETKLEAQRTSLRTLN